MKSNTASRSALRSQVDAFVASSLATSNASLDTFIADLEIALATAKFARAATDLNERVILTTSACRTTHQTASVAKLAVEDAKTARAFAA